MQEQLQANFRISRETLEKMRGYVPKGKQSEFVESAIKKELKRIQFQEVLEHTFNAWGKRGDLGTTERFIRSLRKKRRLKRSA